MSTGAPNQQAAGSPEPDIPGRHLHWRLLLRRPELLRRGSLIALFAVVGPGVLAGLSDDDPAGITTYSSPGPSTAMRFSGFWRSPRSL